MLVPRLDGEIQRRLLVNYRVDPEWIARILPQPFCPQVVNGYAMAGICLIRLGSMRPALRPGGSGSAARMPPTGSPLHGRPATVPVRVCISRAVTATR